MLLWLDIETTGLDPKTDSILEVAWKVSSDDLTPKTVLRHNVVRVSTDIYARLHESPEVLAMHTDTGLLDEIDADKNLLLLEDIEDEILKDIDGVDSGLMLAGYSVHFDKSFIDEYMPRLSSKLSHRIYDVSTLRTMFDELGYLERVPNDNKHRAASDTQNAYLQAFTYKSIVQSLSPKDITDAKR